MELDTYEREVERYGGLKGVLVMEEIAHADSEAVLSVLQALPKVDREAVRWKACLLGLHRLLKDLCEAEEHIEVLRRAREGLVKEHAHIEGVQASSLSILRQQRTQLERLLLENQDPQLNMSAIRESFDRRSNSLSSSVARLRNLERRNELGQSLPDLAISYLHLHANRLLRSEHRLHELILYDLLFRLYKSWHARA